MCTDTELNEYLDETPQLEDLDYLYEQAKDEFILCNSVQELLRLKEFYGVWGFSKLKRFVDSRILEELKQQEESIDMKQEVL